MAQLALGPWRSRGEVRPAELARAMGVSRWTEWRTRLDAARAGLVRDWTLPDPEARGYGRGAVRVLELAFVRTREVTQRVAANREEKASRAERRRQARRRAKEASRAVTPATAAEAPATPSAPVRREELTSPAAGRLWEMLHRLQPAPESGGPALPPLAPTAGVAAARAAVPEVEWSDLLDPGRSGRRPLPAVAAPRAPPGSPSERCRRRRAALRRDHPAPTRPPALQQSQPGGANGCASEPATGEIALGIQRSRTRQRLLRSQRKRAPAGPAAGRPAPRINRSRHGPAAARGVSVPVEQSALADPAGPLKVGELTLFNRRRHPAGIRPRRAAATSARTGAASKGQT